MDTQPSSASAAPAQTSNIAETDLTSPANTPSAEQVTSSSSNEHVGDTGKGSHLIEELLLGAAALYFLPTLIAIGKPRFTAIFAANLFTGWTFVGWVTSLVWALAERKPKKLSEPIVKLSGGDDEGRRVRCPSCAELILPEAKVCRFCGTATAAFSPPTAAALHLPADNLWAEEIRTSSTPSSVAVASHAWSIPDALIMRIVLGGAVVLAALAIIGIWIGSTRSGNSTAPAIAAAPTQSNQIDQPGVTTAAPAPMTNPVPSAPQSVPAISAPKSWTEITSLTDYANRIKHQWVKYDAGDTTFQTSYVDLASIIREGDTVAVLDMQDWNPPIEVGTTPEYLGSGLSLVRFDCGSVPRSMIVAGVNFHGRMGSGTPQDGAADVPKEPPDGWHVMQVGANSGMLEARDIICNYGRSSAPGTSAPPDAPKPKAPTAPSQRFPHASLDPNRKNRAKERTKEVTGAASPTMRTGGIVARVAAFPALPARR